MVFHAKVHSWQACSQATESQPFPPLGQALRIGKVLRDLDCEILLKPGLSCLRHRPHAREAYPTPFACHSSGARALQSLRLRAASLRETSPFRRAGTPFGGRHAMPARVAPPFPLPSALRAFGMLDFSKQDFGQDESATSNSKESNKLALQKIKGTKIVLIAYI